MQVERCPYCNCDTAKEIRHTGLLDYMQTYHASVHNLVSFFDRFTKYQSAMTASIHAGASELEGLKQQYDQDAKIVGFQAQPDFVRSARKVVNTIAGEMEKFVQLATPEIQQFRSSSRDLLTSLRSSIADNEWADQKESNAKEIRQSLSTLLDTIHQSLSTLSSWQTVVRQTPGMTKEYKRARKRAADLIGSLIAELSFFADEVRTCLDSIP